MFAEEAYAWYSSALTVMFSVCAVFFWNFLFQ